MNWSHCNAVRRWDIKSFASSRSTSPLLCQKFIWISIFHNQIKCICWVCYVTLQYVVVLACYLVIFLQLLHQNQIVTSSQVNVIFHVLPIFLIWTAGQLNTVAHILAKYWREITRHVMLTIRYELLINNYAFVEYELTNMGLNIFGYNNMLVACIWA